MKRKRVKQSPDGMTDAERDFKNGVPYHPGMSWSHFEYYSAHEKHELSEIKRRSHETKATNHISPEHG